jgi:redox-sensitive bicupin YhaK (pirin superfamily)
MMIPYPTRQRGYTKLDWLESHHTFSFGDFYDPERMGVSVLRVINDDIVAGGGGFGTHPHRDMEIITYMVDGTIAHRDSIGNTEQIRAGEVQRMTAGSGIAHSEFNASKDKALRLLQIWIKPAQANLPPSYEQKTIPQRAGLTWLASGDRTDGTLHVHQDVRLGRVVGEGEHTLPLAADRIGFLQLVKGSARVGGEQWREGDALAFVEEANPGVQLDAGAEALWFDLPAIKH